MLDATMRNAPLIVSTIELLIVTRHLQPRIVTIHHCQTADCAKETRSSSSYINQQLTTRGKEVPQCLLVIPCRAPEFRVRSSWRSSIAPPVAVWWGDHAAPPPPPDLSSLRVGRERPASCYQGNDIGVTWVVWKPWHFCCWDVEVGLQEES